MKVTKAYYGAIAGENIYQFTIENDTGICVRIINYGGIITHLLIPDASGNLEDVVCGFGTLEGYLGDHPYFGAIIGRYGNRIAGGRFVLDGIEYQLPVNNGPNCLHGGLKDFSKRVWRASVIEDENQSGIILHRLSPHMEEGFPGSLDVNVSYLLTNDNRLIIHYEATTDQPTVLNLTNHSYFNLAGHGNESIHHHYLRIKADEYTPVDENMIPTGEITSVDGTPFDFRSLRKIGERMSNFNHPMLANAQGYDVNYVFENSHGQIRPVATLVHPLSGRTMDVATTEPGMQLYCSNWVDGIKGKGDTTYNQYCAVCLETQHFPDAPNRVSFPSTVLRPGVKFNSTTVYSFRISP